MTRHYILPAVRRIMLKYGVTESVARTCVYLERGEAALHG
jgi:hypothetical protein